jgi:hypothetical protein
MLRLKREVMMLLGFAPNCHTNVNRAEKVESKDIEFIAEYSPGITQEIYDPRSNRNVGHYFNARGIYRLKNVLVEPRQASMYTSSGLLIAESTNWTTSHYYNSFPWNPRPRKYPKLEIENAIVFSSAAFGHWLAEDLGSLIHLIDEFPNSPVIVSKYCPRFVREFLRNYDREIIYLSGPTQLNSVIMVTKQQDSGWMHPRDLANLENFSAGLKQEIMPVYKKVYATRRALRRSPRNEADVEKLFAEHGYAILQLEELNFVNEINLLKNTQTLAGVSGSWQANSIWMPRRSTIVDIVNENYWTELGHRMCAMKDVKYRWFLTSGAFEDSLDLKSLNTFLNSID